MTVHDQLSGSLSMERKDTDKNAVNLPPLLWAVSPYQTRNRKSTLLDIIVTPFGYRLVLIRHR